MQDYSNPESRNKMRAAGGMTGNAAKMPGAAIGGGATRRKALARSPAKCPCQCPAQTLLSPSTKKKAARSRHPLALTTASSTE